MFGLVQLALGGGQKPTRVGIGGRNAIDDEKGTK